MRWSRRLFGLLLLTYPKRIRQERGADMWLTYERHLRDARRAGWFTVFNLWRREVMALMQGGRRARISMRERRRAYRRPVGSERTKRFLAFGMSWLDLKLGFRMLVKYPGLTLVGGLGMAVAVAISAGSFGVVYSFLDPHLPLDEGERVVTVQNWDAARNNPNRQSLHDVVTWSEELTLIEDVSAFRRIGRNLVTADGRAEPVRIALITASGFRVARVLPLMGRTLLEEDEEAGAPPVVVIGYDLWRSHFGSDPDVVGQSVHLGRTVHTVVGVMPEGFAFPINDRIWIPLLDDPSDYERGGGPAIYTFGRLAPGVTFAEARAELSTIGRRMAAAFPDTHEHLRPEVMPYTYPFFDIDNPETVWSLHLIQFLVSLLIVIVCVNVAILVYARTALRGAEIAVRTALGASRRRVVTQLFVEALVFSAGAAIVGFVIAGVSLKQANVLMLQIAGGQIPFWLHFGVSAGTVAYVAGLTLLAGVIVGVLPAVKATGPRVQSSLQHLAAGGSRMQLGGTWTVLIVAQVAVAVAVLPAAVFNSWQFARHGVADPGFAAQEFLAARLAMDSEPSPKEDVEAYRRAYAYRFEDLTAELVRRLDADPGVADVTFGRFIAGGEPTVWIEFDGVPTPAETDGFAVRRGSAGHRVGFNQVDVGFFDTFDVPILTGRGFTLGDIDAAATAVIVNRTFVQRVLGGGNPLGRRLSYTGLSGDAPQDVELGRWYEIVGVVTDFPNPMELGRVVAKLYHPVAPGQVNPMTLALRPRGAEPAAYAGRLRETAAALDPSLQLVGVLSMDALLRDEQGAMRMVALGIAVVTLSVLLLSAAGIYAMMSFTVTQRRREIGIRAALGADSGRMLVSIFTRSAGQLSLGVVVGVVATAVLDGLSGGEFMGGKGAILLPAVSTIMMAVGLLAALGPARRGLRIQPIEALREGG